VNRTKGGREVIRTATNVPGRKTIVTAAMVFMEELSRLPSRATKCEFLWFCCEIRLATYIMTQISGAVPKTSRMWVEFDHGPGSSGWHYVPGGQRHGLKSEWQTS
jgi:hypothetical protein